MNAAPAVITVRGLTKRFGGKTVVDQFDLEVKRGSVCGFLGPNGSGKTTTIRMICGLLRADGGQGQCLGFDIITQSEQIKERVGYMTQRFSLYEDLTIEENLDFAARMFGAANRRARVAQALDDLGLAARASQLAGKLSGGWKQRLALAACSIHDPALLLLDEPTAGVDPKARREFWDAIHRLSDQGVTVLVSTHYMDEAVQCDNIVYIAYGRKLIDAPTSEIADKSGLSTWHVEGGDLAGLAHALETSAGVSQVARFGSALHVSGTDPEALEQAIAPHRDDPSRHWSKAEPDLEDVFIHLMNNAEDNYQ